jgi:radical SAM protein with 4Fe4S-binding SPASM domain
VRCAAPPLPDSLVFEITQRCNHCCAHCYNVWKNERPYPPGELDTVETLALLDRVLEESRVRLVTITGGEPLLRADLDAVVDHLARRGVAINIITNGTLLDAEAIARLAGKVSLYELPLLSVDAAIHDELSGMPGAYHRVTEAIADLRLAGEHVVGVFVATRLNLHTWRETIELGLALGLDGLMLNRFNPGGAGARNLQRLQASVDELRRALDVAEELSERYDFPISCSIAMPPCLFPTDRYRRLTFGSCAAGTERAYYTMDPVGRLRPCNHSPTILGDLRRQSFADLLGGEELRRFVAARPAFCRGCAVEEECLGGCKAAAEACCGSTSAMDPFLAANQQLAVRPPRRG